MKIIWSSLAVEGVSEIAEYIERDNPAAAEKWVHTVFNKVKKLGAFPENGRIFPETKNKSIQELTYGNHRITYRGEKDTSSVLTVRHGKQVLPIDEIKSKSS